jgi:hypothetical protein
VPSAFWTFGGSRIAAQIRHGGYGPQLIRHYTIAFSHFPLPILLILIYLDLFEFCVDIVVHELFELCRSGHYGLFANQRRVASDLRFFRYRVQSFGFRRLRRVSVKFLSSQLAIDSVFGLCCYSWALLARVFELQLFKFQLLSAP